QFELINLYKKTGKDKRIIQVFKDILERNPKNVGAAMELGYYYYKNKMQKESENLLKELGSKSLTDRDIIIRVIQVYLDKKRYDEVLIVLRGMLKGAPESSDINYVIGAVYEGKEDNRAAIMHLKKVMPDSRFYRNAVIHIAFLYQNQGKIKDAIIYLSDIIKSNPDDPELMFYLGTFYEETKEYENAEKALKQALEIDFDNSRIHFRLGVVYDNWGRKDDSIKEMKTVISLDPKNANALNYLGYTYADLGENLDEAERLIKEALKYKPDDGYIIDSLGWVYFKKGDFKKAIKYLKKAVDLVPDDPIILEHLGDAYMKTDNRANALKLYKQSLLNKKNDTTELEKKIKGLRD
ncbi:MAG: tetratricopeptide repeat protein, partial [Desulfobacterales bacterium]|nr:tetratricopeptide repeat protein [Desulfobacterales bacterium]